MLVNRKIQLSEFFLSKGFLHDAWSNPKLQLTVSFS
jgi:hypothetical protein